MILSYWVNPTVTDSDSNAEPRYLDQFSLQFGGRSDSIKSSYKPKRQSSDDPEVDSVLSELLQREQSERRTFPGSGFVVKGAQNLNDDLHQILSDILDGVDDDDDSSFTRGRLNPDEQRIFDSLRELEDESDRRPVRFGSGRLQSNPNFSDDFAASGLRDLGERGSVESGPTLANRGRFDSSGQRFGSGSQDNRSPRQDFSKAGPGKVSFYCRHCRRDRQPRRIHREVREHGLRDPGED